MEDELIFILCVQLLESELNMTADEVACEDCQEFVATLGGK